MQTQALVLAGLRLLTPRRFLDERGYFVTVYQDADYRRLLPDYRGTAQDNMAYSAAVGTVRGLHFQAPPHAQGKLVFALRGAVLDVVVDIRRASPTYGKHVAVQLDDSAGQQLYVPPGFAHGYITLVPDCLVAYKVDASYAPQAEGGLRWNDPALEIDWGAVAQQPVVNPRDATFPLLRDLQSPFV